nr:hypothetical protein [Tanacetum cinerariifolium]
MATDGNGDPPVPDLRTIEELCQPTLNGRGRPIASIAIQAMNFGLKNDMIQQIQNSCQFYGLSGDDAIKHLDKFLHVTQSIKVNEVTDDALCLYLFPYSLTHHATAWFDHFPRNFINTFEQMAKMFLGKYFPPSMVTKLRNEITNFRQRPDESLFESWECYKLSIDRCGTFMKRRLEECYDPIENMTAHHNDWDTSAQQTTVSQTQNVYAVGAYQGGNSYQPQDQHELVDNYNLELKNMFGQFMKMNTASSSGSGTLPSNTVTNPKDDLKGITTQSGTPYQGPTIPTTSFSLLQVVERKTEVTKDTVPPTNNESTKDIQPPVVQIENPIPNSKLVVAPVTESVVAPLSLPELTPTLMTLELANRSISRPIGVTKDVFVKVGKFHFPADFVVVDFDADPRVSLILGRSLLKTERDLIDVYAEELTLRVNNEAETFNLDQTSRYSANYNDMTTNRIDVIDMACEECSKEVLDFFNVIATKNDKSSIDEPPEVQLKDLPPHIEYAFLKGNDKFPIIIAKDLSFEEKVALVKVLKLHKRAIAWKLSDIKGNNPEFCTHKILMEDDFKPAVQHQRRVNPKIHDVIKKEVEKLLDAGLIYPILDSPWIKKRPHSCVLMERSHIVACLSGYAMHREKSHFMVKKGIVLGHKISKNRIKIDKAKVDVIAKLPHPTTVKGIRSFLSYAGFYRRFIQDFSKIAWSKTHLLEKDTPFFFSKVCVEAFQTLKRKLTKAPILVTPDWDLPFELMCDATDFAIGAVLGQRHEKHFRLIHYASKTMTEAESHYTTTKKEMLAVVYAFEKIWSYLILNKSIVYTDHSALKYLFAKKYSKARLLRWVLLLQEFKFKEMSSQQKKKFFKDVKHYFGTTPSCLKAVRIKSSGGVFTARKPLTFSRLAIIDPPRDIMARTTPPKRPFPSSRGNKYILVVVDYLSKWVEAKALPTNDARVVCKFLKSLFAMFGTPRAIISDRGTYFCNDQFMKVMPKYGFTHCLATVYHLQTSWQVEVSNRGLKRILERTVGENRASWSDKTAGNHRKVQLNELNVLRDQSYENSLIYKEKTKKLRDSKIKDRVFNVGD